VEYFASVHRKPEPAEHNFHSQQAEGAVKRCEASVKRLHRMNEVLESLSEAAWSSSDDMQTLAKRFRLNHYYPTIRSTMLKSRLMHHQSQPITNDIDSDAVDPNLHENARKCGAEISDEVSSDSLQMLENEP
jgi:hypothetical protein